VYKTLIIISLVIFAGCSVKVLTFGTEIVKDHQDIIIGKKTDEED